MFQTDFILFLQSFSNGFIDSFFLFVTSLGDEFAIQAFIIILLFGVDFRAGFFLLQLILVNAVATGFLKSFFALPRPFNVDAAVQVPGGAYDPTAGLSGRDAATFWGLLPKDAVWHFRMHLPNSFGFPSGHTSSAVALWGGIALLFKKWGLTILCLLLILLVPLSRLYLGRHFPADVLGGYLLGGLLLFLFHRYAFQSSPVKDMLFSKNLDTVNTPPMPAIIGFLVPVLLIGFQIQPEYAAMWLGINIGYYWIRRKGVPDDAAPVSQRIGRVALAGAWFYILDYLSAPLIQWSQATEADFLRYLIITAVLFLFIWLATQAMVWLGWFALARMPEK